MKIMKAGSRPQKKASSDYFHGNVFQDAIIEAPEPARVRAIKVIPSVMVLLSSPLRSLVRHQQV